jgi:hypothetical protein
MRCPNCANTEIVLVEINHHLKLTIKGLAAINLDNTPTAQSGEARQCANGRSDVTGGWCGSRSLGEPLKFGVTEVHRVDVAIDHD